MLGKVKQQDLATRKLLVIGSYWLLVIGSYCQETFPGCAGDKHPKGNGLQEKGMRGLSDSNSKIFCCKEETILG